MRGLLLVDSSGGGGSRILGSLKLASQHGIVLLERGAVLTETTPAEPCFPGPLAEPVGNRTDRLDLHDGLVFGNNEIAEALVVRNEPGE
jgi:hypothetical protein